MNKVLDRFKCGKEESAALKVAFLGETIKKYHLKLRTSALCSSQVLLQFNVCFPLMTATHVVEDGWQAVVFGITIRTTDNTEETNRPSGSWRAEEQLICLPF